MAMSFDLPTGRMAALAAALPVCTKCRNGTHLVNTIRRFGDLPEVQIIECTACRYHEFYALIAGALEKI
jgi:DNA-directed RNA polymerase subunit M/transcription elongation factor TFIIS